MIRPTWQLDPWGYPARLDRNVTLRLDHATMAAAWAEPGSRVIEVSTTGEVDGSTPGRPTSGEFDPERSAYLGLLAGGHWFARQSEDAVEHRVTLGDGHFEPDVTEAVAAATAITAWHRMVRYCTRCGGALRLDLGGFSQTCRACGHQSFPRTDPAMIVAVRDADDRLLLAHQTKWGAARVSILAGFLEAGESVEQTVHREVAEEVGLRLSALCYLGSQPWPLPRSLMLAFTARSGGPVQVDGTELAWGRWFSRADVDAAVAGGEITLPGRGSVASRIIADWRAGTLPAPESDNVGC